MNEQTLCVLFFSRIQLFLDVLMKEILCPESQSPDGVRFHFIDIYLDELSTVGGREVSGQMLCQQWDVTLLLGELSRNAVC
jgi:hypothetical protein